MGTFSAKRLYQDGYQWDGYEIVELVDGYQIDSTILRPWDFARLKRHLSKVDYLVQHSQQARLITTPQLPAWATSLQAAFVEQVTNVSLDEARIARLEQLLVKHVTLCTAIDNIDGYGQ
jgi:hypothetical protein